MCVCVCCAQVLCSQLSEMDSLIHRMLDLKAELGAWQDGVPRPPELTNEAVTHLSILMTQFTQVTIVLLERVSWIC